MDPPLSVPPILQSGEVDTMMPDISIESRNLQATLQNRFIDPGVLFNEQQAPLATFTSTEDMSPEPSPEQSEPPDQVVPRRKFLPTGCCYDDRMKLHANADFSASPHHPEDPRRIEAIMQEFKEAGLLYYGTEQALTEILKESPSRWMWRIAARRATRAEICLAHTPAHFDWVEHLGKMSSAELRSLTHDFDAGRKSLYVGSLSYEAALISAGGAIETCKNVVAGHVKNAIAVIRPPGHHAEHNESMGFCIFNNVPIAAKVCMADYPDSCRKVLILDWDVHHGNGIQNMFWEDPNVLYISIHVFQAGKFYPGQPDQEGIPNGDIDKCGAGRGLGKNINIGWHDQGMGDGEYMAAFEKLVMPIAREFDPDLVIVSAGFDAAAGDELGGCYVTPGCYAHMTHMLMGLADGKIAVCLEGGYDLRAISNSALAVAKTLMGEPPGRISIPQINEQAAQLIENVERIQSSYWNCMKLDMLPQGRLQVQGIERFSETIRRSQKAQLEMKHNMTTLFIQREKLSTSFQNQVLVTPNLWNAKKILLIIHDPPEILIEPDPVTKSVMAHNAFVNDGLMPYIDWAVGHGYGIVDINIPQYVSSDTDTDSLTSRSSDSNLQQQSKELLSYIWENYLEINTRCSITLMGVGDAYLGVKQLLTSKDVKSKIPSVLCFVSGSLRPVKSETDPYLSQWYKSSSLVYVSPDHSCWIDEENARKVRKKRFGQVEMSEVSGLRAMLEMYSSEGCKWIEDKTREWEINNGFAESDDDMDGRRDPEETESEGEKGPGSGIGALT